MSHPSAMEEIRFELPGGLRIAGDAMGPAGGRPILFLHGGGQTRRSWKESVGRAAALGYRALALDARGHGESSRQPQGEYTLQAFCSDLLQIVCRFDTPPILVGASLGGIVSLLAAGEGGPPASSALVLVDVAARSNPAGVARIQAFMRAHPEGFASLEEAAQAVTGYAPDRPRPANVAGLARNLRRIGGRFYWHWDERFLDSWHPSHMAGLERLESAAVRVKVPTLLVHAGKSDVLGSDEVEHLRKLVPHAEYARVSQAGHMVVGDRNDEFNRAIFGFLRRHAAPQS